MNPRRALFLATVIGVLASHSAARVDLVGPYMLDQWSSSGIADGTTSIEPAFVNSADFSYEVDLPGGGGVPFRTTTFGVVAHASGTATFDWHWTGHHAWFMSNGELQVYADSSSGMTTVDLFPYGDIPNGFDLSGSASIEVEAGYDFGIVVGGDNFDNTNLMYGTVSLSNLTVSAEDFAGAYLMESWTASDMEDATTTIDPASGESSFAEFGYEVSIPGGGGVTFRTASYSTTAADDGTVTFDWHWTGHHAWFMSNGELQVYADSSSGTTIVDLFPYGDIPNGFDLSGSASIEVEAGYEFGIVVGGDNFDNTNLMYGTVTLSAFAVTRIGFEGPYDVSNWTSPGIADGTVSMGPSLGVPCEDGVFSYVVDLPGGGGVPFRTTTFSVMSHANGTVTFDWNWTGHHAWFMSNGVLQVYADSSSGMTTVDLFPYGDIPNGFDLSGSASIDVEAGYEFGIVVGGDNNDNTNLMNGSVTVSEFMSPCPPDANFDGQVNVDDLTAVILDWGTDGSQFNGDVDGSGMVDVDDLTAVILGWGPCE